MLVTECFPDKAEGLVFLPVGGRPNTVADTYDCSDGWTEYAFEYPGQLDAMAAHVEENRVERDVFICGSLFYTPRVGRAERNKRSLKEAWIVRIDWDGEDADRGQAIKRTVELGGFITGSGSGPHMHLWFPLAEPIRNPPAYEELWGHIAAYIGGACDKKTCEALKRPVGSLNQKGRVMSGRDGKPTPVVWVVEPNGERIELAALANKLGTAVAVTQSAVSSPQEPRTTTVKTKPVLKPVDLDDHPLVRVALSKPVLKSDGTEDRSETGFQIVAACGDSGLTLAETEWAVRQRPSVAERVDAHPEDVLRSWLKAVDTDQGQRRAQRQEREAMAALVPKKTDGRPQLWKADKLQPIRQSTFLAKHRIPYGAATILCGDEGIGKSLLWVLIVAAVTTGRALSAFGIPEREPADVILILTEDSWAEDVLPRLTVAGANLDRIHVICTEDDGTGSPTFPDDMHLIFEADVKPALVVVDAWLDTVPGSLSVRDTQQSRTALHPWKEAAGKTGAAVLLLTHTNRLDTSNMRDKYGATASLRQKARMTLFALADPEDGTLIVGPDKANNSPGGTHAARFRILGEQYFNPTPDHDGTVPSLQYLGATDKTIKQHLAEIMPADREHKRHRTGAEAWLVEFLAEGPRSAADVFETGAQAEGLSADQLKRAKAKLARSYAKPDSSTGKQCWYWELLKPGGTAANSEGESSV